jgi:hypothetical protein
MRENEMIGNVNPIAAAMLVLCFGALPLAGVRAEDAATDKPLATIQGDVQGVHVDVLSLKRTEGDMLTLRVAFVNESGATVKNGDFPGMTGSGWQAELIDYRNKRRYGMTTSDGGCLCTTNLIASRDFEPGRKVLWAKFRAPPDSVQKITLMAGTGEPVEGLPITR